MSHTYEILSQSDLAGLTYADLKQDSASTVRENKDNSEGIIAYSGSRPSSLSAITALTKDTRTAHTNAQASILMAAGGDSGWLE